MIAGIHSISISGLKQSYGLAEKHYQFWKKKNKTKFNATYMFIVAVVGGGEV